MAKLIINNSDTYEPITVQLTEENTPIAFKMKVKSLINSGLSLEDAKKVAMEPIELELYYDPDTGLFAVESEAVEAGTIYNPYTAELLWESDWINDEVEE